jgi:hypothetical protein
MNDPEKVEQKIQVTRVKSVSLNTKKTLISLVYIVAAAVALLVLIGYTLFR